MTFLGTYAGTVISAGDPLKLGRVKVRVPAVYGPVGTDGITDADIPWAVPAGLPAGGSSDSGGFSWLPANGDQVLVRFLDGEPEKPIYEWAMQTQPQAAGFVLHPYTKKDGKPVPPKKGMLTRYGHTLEFNPLGVIATSANGYALLLNDSKMKDGSVELTTPLGQYVSLDDGIQTLVFTTYNVYGTCYDSYMYNSVEYEFKVSGYYNVARFGSAATFQVGRAYTPSIADPLDSGVTNPPELPPDPDLFICDTDILLGRSDLSNIMVTSQDTLGIYTAAVTAKFSASLTMDVPATTLTGETMDATYGVITATVTTLDWNGDDATLALVALTAKVANDSLVWTDAGIKATLTAFDITTLPVESTVSIPVLTADLPEVTATLGGTLTVATALKIVAGSGEISIAPDTIVVSMGENTVTIQPDSVSMASALGSVKVDATGAQIGAGSFIMRVSAAGFDFTG